MSKKFESVHFKTSDAEAWTAAAEAALAVMGGLFPSLGYITTRSIQEVKSWLGWTEIDLTGGYWLPSLDGDLNYATHEGEWRASVEAEAYIAYDEESYELRGHNAITLWAYCGDRGIRFCHEIDEGVPVWHIFVDYTSRPSSNHMEGWVRWAGKYAGLVTTVEVDDGNVVDRYEQVVGRE